jgi:transcriptional regulator with XRE-family HTH domain
MTTNNRPLDAQAATLAQRLKHAVVKAGGTRAISRKTGISEAMLYRYYQGQPVPSDKLITLAATCNVTPDWFFQTDPLC